MARRYTDREKAAYYKQLAMANRQAVIVGSGAYRTKKRRAPRRKIRTLTPAAAVSPAQAPVVEVSPWETGASTVGGLIGSALGGPAGGALGTLLGRGAHGLFKMLTGFGDYAVQENSIMSGGMSPPELVNSANSGGFLIRHREYLGDINATTDFTIQSYALNPGAGAFPWLAQIATSFEEYRWRGLVFEFKSLSSDAVLSSATSSALGAVIMATQYDVLNPPFANKMQMENYQFACSAKPSVSFPHPVECKKSQTPTGGELYVRGPVFPSGADQRLYDLGVFQLATVGMQAASGVAGELWATYEIELFKQKISSISQVVVDYIELLTTSGSHPLGTADASFGNLGGVVDATNQRYVFPSGLQTGQVFELQYFIVGTAATITAPLLSVSPNLTVLTPISGAITVWQAPVDGVSSVRLDMSIWVELTSPSVDSLNTWVAWGTAGTIPTSATEAWLIVNPQYAQPFL